MGLCCVSRAKTGLSFLECTTPKFHMQILQRRSDGRESNCVQFLEEQELLVGKVEAYRLVGWCQLSKRGRPRSRILSVLMMCIHEDVDF